MMRSTRTGTRAPACPGWSVLLGLMLTATRALSTTAGDLCAPTGDPCYVEGLRVVEPGSVLDFGSRSLVVRRSGTLSLAHGPGRRMVIRAGSLTVEPGGAILATGLPAAPGLPATNGGTIDVTTAGDVRVQAGASTKGRLDVSAEALGGYIDIVAGGAVEIAGVVTSSGAGGDGIAGDIDLVAAGRLTVTSTAEITASGGRTGSGGLITITASGMTIGGLIEATGGDCSSCSIDLDAGAGDLVTSERLDVSATASGGDAGEIALAGGSINIGGPINGTGAAADDLRGGSGATLTVEAIQDVVINARINLLGAAPDGDGGSTEITAGADIVQNQPILAHASGDATAGCGSPFDVSLDAGRDLFLGEVSVRGGSCGGGTVTAQAGASVAIQRDVNADGDNGGPGGAIDVRGQRVTVLAPANLHADATPGALGGTIRLQACLVSQLPRTRLSARGEASRVGGYNWLRASGDVFTIAGTLVAGSATATGPGQNLLEFRTRAPDIQTTASVSPWPTVAANANLPACRRCGNGVIDTLDGEECDPPDPGRGCSSTCRREGCGNRVVDAGEQCDDGNTSACDGCSATCQREVCGNGTRECAEQCDPGSVIACDADHCSASCIQERCGNAIVECDEECDDGTRNGALGGSCDAQCRSTGQGDCGNGRLDGGEECDDGNVTSEDGCSSTCRRETCGDNLVQARLGEECDDANTRSCDGCSSACKRERCGNGVRECSEACDGGLAGGPDCCSATCQIEPAGAVCRGAAGPCDLSEACDGSASTCPPDARRASTAICRLSAGPCDTGEACDGTGTECPPDALAPPATVCRASGGECDPVERCDGTSAACPADAVEPDGVVCRPAAGACDLAETCTGEAAVCPPDARLEGYAEALCELEEIGRAPLCDTVPPALLRVITRNVAAAGSLLRRAAGTGDVRRAARLLKRADAALGAILRASDKWISRQKVDAGCGEVIRRTLRARRELVGSLRAAISPGG